MTTPTRPTLAVELEGSLVTVRYSAPGAPAEKVVSGELLRVANLGPVPFLVLQVRSNRVLLRVAQVNCIDVQADSELRKVGVGT